MIGRSAAALAGLIAAGGCGEGGLTIHLDLPEEPSLSPISQQAAAEVALVVRDASGSKQRLSRTGDSRGGFSLGRLDEGEVSLSIELLGSNGRLLGYGRAADRVAVRSGDDVEVEIKVRRPLVYLSGHPDELATFDASEDVRSTITSGVSLGQVAAATASSADGAEIFVVTEGNGSAALTTLSTSTHQIGEVLASLPGGVGDLAVAEAGFAAVAHRSDLAGAGGGVTLIDLARPETPSFLELGDTRRVVFDDQRGAAYALVRPTVICQVNEQVDAEIVGLGISLDNETPAPLAWTGSAADVAVDPASGILYVADPCAGAVSALDPGSTEGPVPVLDLPAASAVAIHDGMLTAAGNTPVDGGVALALVSLDLMTPGAEPVTLQLPALKERAVSVELDESGQSVEVVAGADAAAVVDMSVVPGTDRIALVSLAAFAINASVDSGFEVTPDMLLTAWEYQVVDASGALVQRVRTQCDLEVEIDPNTIFTEWGCGQADNQTVPAVEFEPRTLNVLFGSR